MKAPVFMTRQFGSAKLYLGNHGPTIMTGAGVAGFIATTVLTARATLKAQDKLPELERKVEKAKDLVKASRDGRVSKGIALSDREQVRILSKAYSETGLELVKIYWPPLLTGSLSIALVLSAHGIMLKRQAGLVAAYSALDASYKAYRKRVADKIGEEEEDRLYRELPPCEMIGDDGEILDPEDVLPVPSPYARFFDETSRNWTKTPEYNLMFLRAQQQWANDRLRAYGYIFLNEVYEALGLDRTQAGQVVGWKLKGNGDGVVDFGLYDIADESNRAFINGLEATVLLDFNVDGPIRI
jgi:hypothetical protein